MSQADCLTALLDYYGLKKEGKVAAGAGGEPCLAGAKVIVILKLCCAIMHFSEYCVYQSV